MIKKIIILTVLISLLFLVACKSEMVEDSVLEEASVEEASVEEVSSSEEVELDEGLGDLEELDSLDEEFGSDVNFDDLEDLDLE